MNQPPHRITCEGVAGKQRFFLGAPFQHALAPAVVDKFINVTTVPNRDGDSVSPFERFTQDLSGGESCEVHHCNPDSAPCSAWLLPYATNIFAKDGQVNFAVTRKKGFKAVQARRFWSGRFGYTNKEASNGPDNVEGCGDETQTRWRAYQSAIDATKFLRLAITANWSQTLYDYSSGSPVPTTTTETMAVTQSIDALSGLLAFSELSLSPNDERNHALASYAPALWTWSEIVSRMTVEIPFPAGSKVCSGNSITITDIHGNVIEQVNWNITAGTFTRTTYQISSNGTSLPTLVESITVSNTEINYSRTETDYNTPNGDPDGISSFTTITATGTLSSPNASDSIYEDIKNLLAHWPLDDDALYPWRSDLKVSAAPLVSRDELSGTAFTTNWFAKDFGNPITDVFGHMLGDDGWVGNCGITLAPDPASGNAVVAVDLPVTNGDVLDGSGAGNPFSHCLPTGYSIIGGSLPPGISFDNTTGLLSGTVTSSGHYGITVAVTGEAPAATGNVLGAPKPAGYQNYFDFNYRDWAGCCFMPPENPGFQTWSWYQLGWGMEVGKFNNDSGCQLPLNATQWANYFQSVNKPQGAWIFYNDPGQNYFGANCVSSNGGSGTLDGGALWAGKYAECLELWDSQNFARPAGDDKFAFDENHVVCATNLSGLDEGSTWTLVDPITGIAPPDITDFSGIWGGPVVGGFFHVASYSAGVVTLGAKVSDVPSLWASKSNGDEQFCFGKLRFPTCPALLGRVGITPDTAGTTFTFDSAQPNFGMDSAAHQEQVDLWDASMTALASDITATRVDDSHFTIAPGSAAVSAAFVTIHGAAKWYVNDTKTKGDYALLEWLADFRSFGEFTRLTGAVDCSGAPISQPTQNAGGGPVANQFASFAQTPGCLPFVPCAPKVVCISPNGETFSNGATYPFPEEFICDEQYGSKWWAWVQSTMTDLFWQRPHRPCNVEPCAKWLMDGGICAENVAGNCPGDDDFIPGESPIPEYYFAHAPQVEARLSVPSNYGINQDESAPTPPDGIQIGWLSPVDYDTGEVALPPLPPGTLSDRGEPAGAATAWDFHALLCDHAAGCRFDYQLPGC